MERRPIFTSWSRVVFAAVMLAVAAACYVRMLFIGTDPFPPEARLGWIPAMVLTFAATRWWTQAGPNDKSTGT